MLDRLGWYARRLAVMERGEIRHRLREQMERRRARREAGGWDRWACPGLRPTALPLFAPLFAGLPSPVEDQLRAAADRFRSGRFRLLNRDWPGSVLNRDGAVDRAAWLLDPASGKSWPGAESSTFDIDFRFGTGRGDVKYVAELNRLHILPAPAIHARRTGDAGLAKALLASLATWMEANPPGRGVNWYSGIEAGYRLVSLAVVVAALDPWIDKASGERLAAFTAAHGSWLLRFPSLFSSANNHLVAEAMGLVFAAKLLPGHSAAGAWAASGRKHLADRTLALFASDGVGLEQSPAYSAFTLEMLLLGFAALDEGLQDATLRDRLGNATAALSAFADDAGHVPLIGDDDGSRVLLAFGSEEPRYAASVAGALAGFLRRADLSPPARDPHWRDAMFGTPPPGAPPPDGTVTFGEGGYTIRRAAVAGRRAHLVFDHGPLGFGALAAHGHADALSVWLSLDGKPVLVDAGTHLYHAEGENRRRFRVSAVHNTLTVAELSQSEPSGAFNWMPRRARAKLESVAGTSDAGTGELDVAASHDGYEKTFGLVHHRALRETAEGFVITDRLTGPEPAGAVEIAFLFAPELTVAVEGGRVVARRGSLPELAVVPPADASVALVRGDEKSGRGLHSPGFGVLVPATTAVFTVPAAAMRWETRLQLNPST